MKQKPKKPLLFFTRIMAAVFLFLLFVLVVCNLFAPDREFSEKENRALAKPPAASLHNLTDGRFMTQAETYVNDQFVFRDLWIQLKSGTDILLGKKEANGVYLGKHGRLFEQFEAPADSALQKQAKALQDFSARYPDLKQYFLLAPTAINIYQEDLPLWAPAQDQNAAMDSLFSALSDTSLQVIDVREPFRMEKESNLFYKTDHHWTTNGAYVAFQHAASTMELDLSAVKYSHYPVTDAFQGTLSAKSGFEDGETETLELYFPEQETAYVVNYVEEQRKSATLYHSKSLEGRDKYAVFFGGNHALIDIQTASSRQNTLLVVKDSYANAFLPFLIPYYREIVVVDPRYYYDSIDTLIQDYGIQEVLFLYNANTFFADTSLTLTLQPAPAQPAEDDTTDSAPEAAPEADPSSKTEE